MAKAKARFTVSVGRMMYGFQEACYEGAIKNHLDITIKRLGGFFEVSYYITLLGEEENIRRFINWIKSLET